MQNIILTYLIRRDIVYVLYSRSKIVLGVMLAALVAEVTVMVTTLSIVLPKLTYRPDCLISSSPGLFMAFWSVNYEPFEV